MRLGSTFTAIKSCWYLISYTGTYNSLLVPGHLTTNLRSDALLNARLKAAAIHGEIISCGI